MNTVGTSPASSSAVPHRRRSRPRPYAFKLVWPEICRRLEAHPNLNASGLFDQLREEYPDRFFPGQVHALQRQVKAWRFAAVARGVVIGRLKYRTSGLARTWRTRIDPFASVWPELCMLLDNDPDQTGRELFTNSGPAIRTANGPAFSARSGGVGKPGALKPHAVLSSG